MFNHLINQTPPEMKNGKVTLATGRSLALNRRNPTTTERKDIDVTQEIDEKTVIFQVHV